MKYSGIGGQAVLEGVMMRNGGKYAVAVRKPDKDIVVEVNRFNSISDKYSFLKLPFVRGVINFVESLYIGLKTLSFSASFYEEEEEKKQVDKKKEDLTQILTVILSISLAIGLFIALPYGLSLIFRTVTSSEVMLTVIEGIIRLTLLVLYMAGISFMPDIKRLYMYHGAEHKAINCIEAGLPLTPKNVKRMSRRHLRCGTSFMVDVIILSIILFMFIRIENLALRLLVRILIVPVIAAVAYEFIRLAGRTENIIIKILSMPGIFMQAITTREPDEDMTEVAIASVEAVFDWEAFIAPSGKNADSIPERSKASEAGKKTEKTELKADASSDGKVETSAAQKQEQLVKKAKAATKGKEEAKKHGAAESSEDENDEVLNALNHFFNSKKTEGGKPKRK